MAKKAPAPKSVELDGKEFFAAVNLIEQEKGIPKGYMLEKITQALVAAYIDSPGIGIQHDIELMLRIYPQPL